MIFTKHLDPNLSIHTKINLYSPNCQFKILKNNKTVEINLFNNFYQEYSEDPSSLYEIFFYKYYPLKFITNKCILSISSILDLKNELKEEEIKEFTEPSVDLIIMENTPQKFKFKNINETIKLKYPNVNNGKSLFVNIRLINVDEYRIYFYENLKRIIKKYYYFYYNKITYFTTDDLKNIKDLIIEISLFEIYYKKSESKYLEISVKQIDNKFYYLEKGIIKNDLLIPNNSSFFYTDIGKEDEGYIMIDFLKMKGEIYGKIIKINETIINSEVDWESINGTIISNYDIYTKKLIFKRKDTSICTDGCYLLLKVKLKDIHEIYKEKKKKSFSN